MYLRHVPVSACGPCACRQIAWYLTLCHTKAVPPLSPSGLGWEPAAGCVGALMLLEVELHCRAHSQ